jgi:hypothetical protein
LLVCYRLLDVGKHSEIKIESSSLLPPPPVIIIVVDNGIDAAAVKNDNNDSDNNNVTCWGDYYMGFGLDVCIYCTYTLNLYNYK